MEPFKFQFTLDESKISNVAFSESSIYLGTQAGDVLLYKADSKDQNISAGQVSLAMKKKAWKETNPANGGRQRVKFFIGSL